MNITIPFSGELRSLGRFPVAVLVAVVLAAVANLQIAHVLTMGDVLESQVMFALIGGGLAALIVELCAESHGLSRTASIGASAAAAAVIAALQFFHRGLYDQDLVVIGALLLALMVAAHLRRGATIESFWRFNLKLGIAAGMGIVAMLVVCGGLSILLASMEYLFDVSIRERPYGHIWTTGATLLAPLFAVSMVPAEVDEPFIAGVDPDLLERAVAAVIDFALAPLVLAYALMLHVYALRIALTATMPKGEIGRLVLAFGITGTAAYMIAYPWREAGSRAVRWLMASWFWLMVIPAVLLLIAVSQRIAQYGVTPQRYCLCLFAAWLAGMAAYLGIKGRRIDLRVIPGALAIGLLLSSFGPWGAAAVSVRSQLRELHQRLEEKNLFADGRLKLDPPRLAAFNRVSASDKRLLSILQELSSLDALDRIAPLFFSIEDNPFTAGRTAEDVANRLALYPQYQYQPPKPVEASSDSVDLKVDLRRYDRMIGPIWIGEKGVSAGDPAAPERSDADIADLQVSRQGSFMYVMYLQPLPRSVSFDLAPILGQRGGGAKRRGHPVLLPAMAGGPFPATLVIVQSSPAESRMQAWVLLGTPAPTTK